MVPHLEPSVMCVCVCVCVREREREREGERGNSKFHIGIVCLSDYSGGSFHSEVCLKRYINTLERVGIPGQSPQLAGIFLPVSLCL